MATRKRTTKQATANRKRPFATFTLSPAALAALEALAEYEGIGKSAVVEQLIRREAREHGLDLEALGRKERRRRGLPPG